MKIHAPLVAVLLAGAPAFAQGSDSCSTPTPVSGNGPFSFNNASATTGSQGQPVCGVTCGRDVWFVWTAPTTATYEVSTCGGTSIDSVIGVYAGSGCPSGGAIGCNDDACNTQSIAAFAATQGSSYTIQLGSFNTSAGGSGTFTITLQVPCGGTTGPDVIVGDITGPANYTANGSLEALSLGTTSCNMGNAGVGWHSNTNQHPVIGGELYRFKVVAGAGRFEQVGLSWLKHGFFAESQVLCCPSCSATDGTTLGVGCADPYTAGRNGTQSLLGPRFQVNAHTGFFVYPPPHPSGGNTGRLEVLTSDLEASNPNGTRYFGNSQYIAPDDATSGNGNNNCSYIEVTVTGSGSAWSFGFSGSTHREIPAVQAWPTCESGVTVNAVQIPNEGLLLVGFKATPLGGGQYHYEYALYNMNSDDCVRSFSLPIGSGAVVSNLGFHDVTYRGGDGVGGVNYDGTDWPATNSGGALSWSTSTFAQNANANAVRWGTTYNFRFDANTAPATGVLTLGLFKSGGTITTQALVPSSAAPPDCNHNGIPDNLDIQNGTSQDCDGNGVPDECQADTDGDGTIDACDGCPNDPNKIAPGQCGCGVPDTDTDGDGTPDCHDGCPNDPNKITPGQCGCGVPDTDTDGDGTADCHDGCPNDPNKIAPGVCGCGVSDQDTDHDGTPDCHDGCPNDPNKIAPGACGCGVPDTDTDGDGTPDCHDGCPNDPNKIAPGACGCGIPDTDTDGDGVPDCHDNCPSIPNPGQGDCNGDGVGDACEIAAGAPDCNGNGIPDSCDIASGSAPDDNGNGVPDSCEQVGLPYCSGDGTTAACPCGNSGAPGHGCANSIGQSALLTAEGTTTPDTLVLSASGELPTALTIFMQGNASVPPVLFGDGLRCVGGSLKRLYARNAVAGHVFAPHPGDPSITARSTALGDPIPSGGIRYYMTYYRDASASFCPSPPGGTFNASNALSITW